MHLSVSSQLTFLLRILLPKAAIKYDTRGVEALDAPAEWSLASMMAEKGAAKVGLASFEEVTRDLDACKRSPLLGPDAQSQARLPIHEGGVLGGWPQNQRRFQGCGLLYVGLQILTVAMGRVMAASAREELAALLERRPDPPMTAGLVTERKNIAEVTKESQLNEIRVASCGIGRPG